MTIQTNIPAKVIEQISDMKFERTWTRDTVAKANTGIHRVTRWAKPAEGEPVGDGEFFQIVGGEVQYGIFTDAYDDQPTTGSWRILHRCSISQVIAEHRFCALWDEAKMSGRATSHLLDLIQKYF